MNREQYIAPRPVVSTPGPRRPVVKESEKKRAMTAREFLSIAARLQGRERAGLGRLTSAGRLGGGAHE